jgi:hypothetical protein
VFVSGKPSQPSLMFMGKAGAYRVKQLSPNTLAYYEKSYITAVKSFIGLATGFNLIKLFGVNLRTLYVN